MSILTQSRDVRHLRVVRPSDTETHPSWCWTKLVCKGQHDAEPVTVPATGGAYLLGDQYAQFPVVETYAQVADGAPYVVLMPSCPLNGFADIAIPATHVGGVVSALLGAACGTGSPAFRSRNTEGGDATVTFEPVANGVTVTVGGSAATVAVTLRHDEARRVADALSAAAAVAIGPAQWVISDCWDM